MKTFLCLAFYCLILSFKCVFSDECLAQPGKLEPGRKCRRSCKVNSDCKDTARKTCNCDDYCGMTCFNKGAVCEEPEPVPNGSFTYKTKTYASTVTYSCKLKYKLAGEAKRKCRSDKKWSGSAPKCEPVEECPYPPKVTAAFADVRSPEFPRGTVISYKCLYGYIRNGQADIKCRDDLTWSAPTFSCTKLSCGDPGKPIHGYLESDASFLFGTWAIFKCDKGYYMEDPSKNRRFCSATGKWTGSNPTCIISECSPPEDPVNGRAVIDGISYEYGSVVKYLCNDGFISRGNLEGKCNENGDWGPLPTCGVDINCDFDDTVRHTCGYKNIGSAKWKREFLKEGTKSENPGYVLKFVPESDTDTASLISPLIPSKTPHCLQFYYKSDQQVQIGMHIVVKVNENIITAASLVNVPTDRWIGAQFTMNADSIKGIKFELMATGRKTFAIDDLIVVKDACKSQCSSDTNPCENGGECVTEIDTYYCSCTKFFTGRLCSKEIICKLPTGPKYGSVDGKPNSRFGERITYSCGVGFELQGSTSASCRRDGSWSRKAPTCTRKVKYSGKCPQNFHQFGLMCYGFHDQELSHAEAQKACESRRATLATIQSIRVDDHVASKMRNKAYWIGIGKTNKWNAGYDYISVRDVKKDPKDVSKCGQITRFWSFWGVKHKVKISWRNCETPKSFLCETWSTEATNYHVKVDGGDVKSLTGVYKPIPGLITEDQFPLYSMEGVGETHYLYHHWFRGAGWLWIIGFYSVADNVPGDQWYLRVHSAERFPNALQTDWTDGAGKKIKVVISKFDGWGPWSEWKSCSTTCGAGVQEKERKCYSDTPSNLECAGKNAETKECNLGPCDAPKITDKTREVIFERTKYVFTEKKVQHSKAGAECQKLGGTLAQIKSRKLNDVLMKKMDQIVPKVDTRGQFFAYWIDLKDTSGTANLFTWGDGDSMRASDGYWAPTEPNGSGSQPCVNIAVWRERSGYIGWNDEDCHKNEKVLCQIADPCSLECKNEGRCKIKDGIHICFCKSGFRGDLCEIDENDPCSVNPCQNDGKCKRDGSSYRCECYQQTWGDHCENTVDSCLPNPCKNQGKCEAEGNSYRCICKENSSGNRCENVLNACTPTLCGKGSCIMQGASYNCQCPVGTTGVHCETEISVQDPCANNPCLNGGRCRPSGANHFCFCPPGDWGPNCEPLGDPCATNPCGPGGKCNREGPKHTCTCLPGYSGSNCEKKQTCSRESIVGNVTVIKYSSNAVLRPGRQVEMDAKVKLQCNNPSSTLIGRDIALCLGDDKWDRSNVILCIPNTTCNAVGSPKNGRIEILQDYVAPYPVGTVIEFKCDRYYKRLGTYQITCQEKGQWSDEPPICKVIGCIISTFDFNTNVVVDGQETDIDFEVEANESLTLKCKGMNNKMKVLCKGIDVWEPDYKSLTSLNCPEVEPLPRGDMTPSRGPPYTVGTVIEFGCDIGHKGKGQSSITCLGNGKWSDPVPYCISYSCTRDLSKVEVGRSCGKACRTTTNCKGDFKRCLCDDWCGKSCFNPEANCKKLEPPKNGYIIGAQRAYGYTVTYGCNEGFILSGPATRRCRSDREWTGEPPECLSFDTCGVAGNVEVSKQIGKVIAGTKAKVGAWPWQTLFFENHGHKLEQVYKRELGFAGGSVINNKWILTAAHVFEDFPGMFKHKAYNKNFLIALGLTVYPEKGTPIPDHVRFYEPLDVIQHTSYVSITYDYDLALVKIGDRLTMKGSKFVKHPNGPHGYVEYSEHIRPVCLPCVVNDPSGNGDKMLNAALCDARRRTLARSLRIEGLNAVIIGFGKKRNFNGHYDFLPKILQQGLLKVLAEASCLKAITVIQRDVPSARFTKRMLCAESANDSIRTDACQGDSGGPLALKLPLMDDPSKHFWTQVGIVSWGWGCGNEHPGFYTSVKSTMTWIWEKAFTSQWMAWSPWQSCDVTCGNGIQRRVRECDGKKCKGLSQEEKTCSEKICLGKWSSWSSYGSCSVTCGGGTQSRSRLCHPSNCPGPNTETRKCNTRSCQGKWSAWGSFYSCSVTCGEGVQVRTRACVPSNCPGTSSETQKCSKSNCPGVILCPEVEVNGFMAQIISPSAGQQFYPGTEIKFSCPVGKFIEKGPHNIKCLNSGQWSDTKRPYCKDEWTQWSTWSACTASCNGVSWRARRCSKGGGGILLGLLGGCSGDNIKYRKCNTGITGCGTGNECKGGSSICVKDNLNIDTSNSLDTLWDLGSILGGRK